MSMCSSVFPFADVPDVGMTIQVMTNGNPETVREDRPRHGRDGVASTRSAADLDQDPYHSGRPSLWRKQAAAKRKKRRSSWPITATAPAPATWLLREIHRTGPVQPP